MENVIIDIRYLGKLKMSQVIFNPDDFSVSMIVNDKIILKMTLEQLEGFKEATNEG